MGHFKNLSDTEELFRLLACMNVIQNHVNAQFTLAAPRELSLAQFSVLRYFSIRENEQATLQHLSHMFGLSKASVGESVDKLAKKKFVSVDPNPDDRRSKLISITPEGFDAYKEALTELHPFLERLGDEVGTDTFRQAADLLMPMRDWLRENK